MIFKTKKEKLLQIEKKNKTFSLTFSLHLSVYLLLFSRLAHLKLTKEK